MIDSLRASVLKPSSGGGQVEGILDHRGKLPPQLPRHNDRLQATVRAKNNWLGGHAGAVEGRRDLVQPRAGLVRG
jgi:hypothetical protein